MKLNKKQYAIVVGNILAFVGLYFANKYFVDKEEDKRQIDEDFGTIFAWGFGLSDDQTSDKVRGQFWSIKDKNNFPPKRIPLDEDLVEMGTYNIVKVSEDDNEINYELQNATDNAVIGSVKVYPQQQLLEFNNLFKTS